jgi:DNA-binding response OmpR family regulator
MNVLFAEDDKTIQKLLSIFFEAWGIDFDIASNGKEAVELARSNEGKYDICLMDTDMPEMNGFEAIKHIRKNVRYFPILSTSGDFTYKNKLLETGADEFISKPHNHKELHQKIIEWSGIKTLLVRHHKNTIETREETPMDAQHAKELRELKKQNLIKVKFDDITGSEVVVHKNIINKIVDDFNLKKQFVSTFLNRNPEKPTKCILFSNNCRMPQVYLSDADYEEELKEEEEDVKKYPTMILKAEEG